MDFNHFLSSYMPDITYGGKRLYKDMIEQAKLADQLGYKGVSIPEHHLINILLVPSPLQMAVKIAAETENVDVVTAVAVLPVRDMRVFAGEVVQAQALCDGRLILGVARGAFGYELGRLGVLIEDSREVFEESLEVLEALLTREEVAWNGKYYQFDPLTIMPRPEDKTPLMMAVLAPPAIEAVAALGYDIQTTPLSASDDLLTDQVNAFHRGRAKAEAAGRSSRLSLQRSMCLVRDEAERQKMLALAASYYDCFDNVFTGPGKVSHGQIEPIKKERNATEFAKSMLICEKNQMIDRLGFYAELGIDEIIVSCNFGQDQSETLDMMQHLAEDVMLRVAKPCRTSTLANL